MPFVLPDNSSTDLNITKVITEKKNKETKRRIVKEPSSLITSLIILISGLNEENTLKTKKPLMRMKDVLIKLMVYMLLIYDFENLAGVYPNYPLILN